MLDKTIWVVSIKIVSILVVTYLVVKVLLSALHKLKFGDKVNRLFSYCVLLVVWSIGLITVLGTLNINISALITGLGLTGFAAGFACKDILANVLSGLILMIYSPFKINDRISVKGKTGKFIDINFRYITLVDGGEIILIPNTTVLNEVILINDSCE